jgi:acyl dehydratase
MEVGESYSESFSFTQEDVNQFGSLTGDKNPIHHDEDYAAQTPFKKPIIHGCLSMSMFSKIIGMDFPGEGSIYMSHDVSFLRPMYVGETYRADLKIMEVNPEKHTALIETNVYSTPNNKITIKGVAKVMHPEKF